MTCILVLFFGVPIMSACRAAPGSSDLTFSPDQPQAGQQVEAGYRPSDVLEGEPRLHLRARLRTPEHDSYNEGMGSLTVAVLERRRDGTYRGEFALPADVVYAAFAVEDTPAARTDSREGSFWELLVHDSDGRPLFDALKQRFNDHMGRDELTVLETARSTVELHPERIEGWSILRAAEGWMLGEKGAEERLSVHRERAREFDLALAQKDAPTADEVGYLYWYARGVDDEEIMERWRQRLVAEYRGHWFAVQDRLVELQSEHGGEPAVLLQGLEEPWETVEDTPARVRIAGLGLQTARRAGDAFAMRRWADRVLAIDPSSRSSVARTLAGSEAAREDGIRMLRAEIAAMERAPDEMRPLGATMAEYEERSKTRAASLQASLGRALLAAGHADEAIAALERAAAVGWSTAWFRSLGEARLSAGDTAGATRAFAAVAADPGDSRGSADSLRLAAGLDPASWAEAVAEARAEMLERMMASARAEPLNPVSLAARDGSEVELAERLGESATVVVHWSRYCGYSVQAMPRIADLAERLAEDGVPLLAVTRDPPAEAEEYLTEGGFEIDVLYDTDGEAARALNSWGTPQYFVLDGAGRLSFAFSSLDELPRQVAALRAHDRGP
jgi:peroxiredoxin